MAEIIKVGRNYNTKNLLSNSNDPTVSKLHLQLFIDDDFNVFVTDLNSSNGTYVNHNRLSNPMLLQEGDMLAAGNCIIRWGEFVESLKNLETKIDVNNNGNENINDNEDIIISKSKEPKSGFWSKYFTYNNEYISGGTYWLRCFLQQYLIFLFGLGLYLAAITSYKRAKSLDFSNSSAMIFAIYYPISFIFGFIISFYVGTSGDNAAYLAFIPLTLPHFYLWFSDGVKKTVLEENFNVSNKSELSNSKLDQQQWSKEEMIAFYSTLVDLAGVDGVDPTEKSIIATYLSKIGFNPSNNKEFKLFMSEAQEMNQEKLYKVLNSFSKQKKELLSEAMKYVILADGEVSSEEVLAEGLVKILADLPHNVITEEDYNYVKSFKK